MRRHELEDREWEQIRDLLPSGGGRGRPWKDHRETLNGMLWILRTGAPWRDLPERYGPWKTVYERFRRWSREGLWDKILQRLQMRLDKQGRSAWDLWCVDGSSIRAHRSAAGGRKKGALLENPTITRWVAQEAGGAQSSTWSLTARVCPSR